MNHKHKKVLQTIFHDPISANIHWRDIEHLLEALGAEIETTHGSRMRVIIDGREDTLHRPHHNAALSRDDVRHLRKFLSAVGVSHN